MRLRPPSHIPHLYVCEEFLGPVVQRTLRQMPLLTKLSLCTRQGVVHGPYWSFLRFALSLPRLREFEMVGLTFCPVVLPDEPFDLEGGACASLTVFRYEAILTRGRKYAISVEKDALALVLEKTHHSLVILALPSEPAPISLMARLDWPNLRELRLRGMRWSAPRTPLVLLFANMPKLRSLALELRIPDDGDPEAVWPPGLPRGTKLPWPELEHLTVANPHPDDEFFAHLPPGLRTLALPSCPRECARDWLWACENPYCLLAHTFHLLPASRLLDVLKRCSASGLRHLEIEYGADEREHDLLRFLAAAFPGLSSLSIYRYRGSRETVVCVEDVVRPLASLECLQALTLHPDFETSPMRVVSGMRGGRLVYPTDALERFADILEGAALGIARTLNKSLERVSLWTPSDREGPFSANFSVFRDDCTNDVRVQRESDTPHEREDVWGM
ncbi:hypothetical protein GSI_09749 [Ganoderma sinense ZZ0214-1]|uniref:F-box domain-containing protein n=1 Tax=Ganoderma sinense ZZ0214-1 TaxID=1077348 RepID=A0A2G8S3G9_9APHY|nr:hypothetical protein GSI_09749 [Ganoderma sinense ZZ0214-1]